MTLNVHATCIQIFEIGNVSFLLTDVFIDERKLKKKILSSNELSTFGKKNLLIVMAINVGRAEQDVGHGGVEKQEHERDERRKKGNISATAEKTKKRKVTDLDQDEFQKKFFILMHNKRSINDQRKLKI